MKGIVLTCGSGTRLYPLTMTISKQLLSVYDKPMVYYPLYMLMIAGIRDILIVSTPTDLSNFERLLGDGSTYGIHLSYKVQYSPESLDLAFTVIEEFIKNKEVTIILGDNIFYDNGLGKLMKHAKDNAGQGMATIFAITSTTQNASATWNLMKTAR